jgi:hypothetical protein
MLVQLFLLKIFTRATKSFAKRALVVPSGFVAVPATVKSFSDAIINAFQSALSFKKMLLLTTYLIVTEWLVLVNQSCHKRLGSFAKIILAQGVVRFFCPIAISLLPKQTGSNNHTSYRREQNNPRQSSTQYLTQSQKSRLDVLQTMHKIS